MAEIHRAIARRHEVAARLHTIHAERLESEPVSARPFMAALAEEVGGRHVGIRLVLGDRTEAMTVASDPIVAAVQELECTLGEGPAHDVTARGVPVVADETAFAARWPLFASAVARFGVRSVAAEPLRSGKGCFGALTVFDPLAEPAVPLATVADALVHTALLAPESDDPLDLPLLVGAEHHEVLHQASGMIAEQLGCDVVHGLAVLRARAYAAETSLAVLAAEVVHNRLRIS